MVRLCQVKMSTLQSPCAKAVFIGRAYLYGVMADGERGVEKVIELMRRDFINTMALTGNRNLEEVRQTGAILRTQ